MSSDDFKSSILSSDESINAKLTKMDFTDDNINGRQSRGQTRLSRKDFYDNKIRQSKEVNSKVKRMLTHDFVKNKMNDSSSSFLNINNNTTFRQ